MYQRAEPVVGKALKTMFEKFGMSREEVFVNSKQGWLLGNNTEEAPAELILEELLKSTNLTQDDFISEGTNKDMFYSLHPEYLNFSLDFSLKQLGLQTLDAVLLTQPFEVAYHSPDLKHASEKRRHIHFYDKLAKAFEFYESAVQDGRIRSYGITAYDSLLYCQK